MLRKFSFLAVALILLIVCVSSTIFAAQEKQTGRRGPQSELSKRIAAANGEVIAAADAYIESCRKLLTFQEADVRTAEETLAKRKRMAGGANTPYGQEAERALAAARSKVEETNRQMAEAESIKIEAQAEAAIKQLPPPRKKGKTAKKPAPRKRPCKGCVVA